MNKTLGSIKSYTLGFVFSIVLTLASFIIYFYYVEKGTSVEIAAASFLSLAVLQLIVQLIFFLHLGHKDGPRWNLVFLLSTVIIFIVVVVGSLWIMYHLNHNMMPHQMEEYLIWKEGIEVKH